MLRKTIIALCTVASVGILAPEVAFAGGHGGGGGRGGGGGLSGGAGVHSGGMGSAGFRSSAIGGTGAAFASSNFRSQGVRGGEGFRGERGEGFRREGFRGEGGERFGRGFRNRDRDFAFGGFALGIGFPYGYYDYPYYDYPYYASYADYDDGGCYLVRRRISTPYGWRIRRVQVCG